MAAIPTSSRVCWLKGRKMDMPKKTSLSQRKASVHFPESVSRSQSDLLWSIDLYRNRLLSPFFTSNDIKRTE
ncbi:hypothetical protein CDAR_453331, partial [Caerostris darwini]